MVVTICQAAGPPSAFAILLSLVQNVLCLIIHRVKTVLQDAAQVSWRLFLSALLLFQERIHHFCLCFPTKDHIDAAGTSSTASHDKKHIL